MSLTIVAGGPERRTNTRKELDNTDWEQISTLCGAYIRGDTATGRAAWNVEMMATEKPKADRLHQKLYYREELANHPLRAEAEARLMAMERMLLNADVQIAADRSASAGARSNCVNAWLRLSNPARAEVERLWQTRASTAEQFTAWLDRQWGSGRYVDLIECPF